MMKGTGGPNPRCGALEGELGRAVCCGIHDRRPSVCHAFTASWAEGEPNDRCDAARARYGMRALTPEDWSEPEPDGGGDGAPLQPAA